MSVMSAKRMATLQELSDLGLPYLLRSTGIKTKNYTIFHKVISFG